MMGMNGKNVTCNHLIIFLLHLHKVTEEIKKKLWLNFWIVCMWSVIFGFKRERKKENLCYMQHIVKWTKIAYIYVVGIYDSVQCTFKMKIFSCFFVAVTLLLLKKWYSSHIRKFALLFMTFFYGSIFNRLIMFSDGNMEIYIWITEAAMRQCEFFSRNSLTEMARYERRFF